MRINKRLDVVYLSKLEGKPLDVDFYALLSYIESVAIKPELLIINVSAVSSGHGIDSVEKFRNGIVYLYVSDIIYLSKISRILATLKKNNELIILGGTSSLSVESIRILEIFSEIDIIVREPENGKVLADLVDRIQNNQDWQRTEGIAFRKSKKFKPTVNKNRHLSDNLDHLSSLGLYENRDSDLEWYPIIVSRGCLYNCQYCGFQVPYRTDYKEEKRYWRKKSEKSVVDEMEFLVSKGINKFIFSCNQFFNSKESDNNAEKIAKEILNRKLKLKFSFTSKPSEIKRNFESLFILREAGMQKMDVGIDSGIKRFHQMYMTGSSVEGNIEVLDLLHKHKFNFDIGFIFYDPYLNIDEIKENLRFLKKIKDYFSHLEQPYSAFLDSQILSSVLVLRYGMPIIQQIKKDNLMVEYPGYSAHPASKFLNQQVKYIYSIYRYVNRDVLPKIRHFFYNKALVEKYDFINLFPLTMLEEILNCVSEDKFSDFKDYVHHAGMYIKKVFRSKIEEIFSDFEQYRNADLEEWFNQ